MATGGNELENAMKRYIDTPGENRGQGRDKLVALLRTESVDTKYDLLMNVRGNSSGLTGIHEAARANDLGIIKNMLDGFPPNKKYDVLKIQSCNDRTPLHFAAYWGHCSIITYLMTNLSQQQKYDIHMMRDRHGDTPLHLAATNEGVKAFHSIIASVPCHMLLDLLNVKNYQGKSAADIRPEINDEFPVSIVQGK